MVVYSLWWGGRRRVQRGGEGAGGGRERMVVDDYTNYLLRTAILEDTENFNVILRSLDC
jgi:hypothetical protein